KVSEAIAASLSLEEVLATVGDTGINEIHGDLVSTWLDDGEGGYFERQRLLPPKHQRGAGLKDGTELGKIAPPAFVEHFNNDQTLLEHGTKAERFFAVASEVPVQSLIAVPLRMKQRLVGWISVTSFTKGKRFDEGQRKLLSIVGSRAAAAIENARLYEDLRATFQQTIEGLAKAIDKMDRYTAGHSDRVAIYATFLAKRLGFSSEAIETVRQSALMHDIGKIGCVLNLNKPGKLSNEEYEIFKKHPGFGKDILDPNKFLHPLIPGVHLHHERWDGRGYPLRMKGNEIPIIARIIAVADTYDAMTSDRSYRRALPHEVAMAEIERCSATQFDPGVAATFTEGIDAYREEERQRGHKVPE